MTRKDAIGAIGKTLLFFGVPLLILAFFGALVLLFGIHRAGFWEVEPMVQFVSFFVWGAPFSISGIVLLWLSSRDK
ncbi:hypothetical protein MUP38_04965 [Candidatus Bathyarchaeota archaeon]|nr:hypothetical protein [Candidatus Bathyarchaeota archaeon]